MINITGTNVTIMTKNMDNAISFYESIGLTLKQRWDDHYAMVVTQGLTIGIHPAEDAELNSGTVSIGFMIDKIEDAKSLLDKNNIAFKAEDGKSGRYLNFKDLDDTALYFVEPGW